MAQTPDGYIWLGSKNGLYLFDGATFTVFDQSSRPALPSARVRNIATSPDGSLWIVTQDNGVARIRDGVLSPIPSTGSFLESLGRPVWADDNGDFWVTSDFGAERWDARAGRSVSYRIPEEVFQRGPRRFWKTGDGALWIESWAATWARFDGHAFILDPAPPSIARSADFILRNMLPPGAPPPGDPVFRDVKNRYLLTLVRDKRGRLWFGTPAGLLVADRGSTRLLTTNDGLPDNYIRSLFEDREGNIWVVTMGGNVAEISTPPVFGMLHADGLLGNMVFSLARTTDDSLWVLTEAALHRYIDGRFSITTAAQGLPHPSQLRSMLGTRDGALWITSLSPNTVVHFASSVFSEHRLPGTESGDFVTALAEDGWGVAWFATARGRLVTAVRGQLAASNLAVPEVGPCPPPTLTRGECPHAINVLVPRRAGGLWGGTFDGRMITLAGGKIASHDLGPLGPKTAILAAHEDSRGALWMGTSNGLYFNKDHATRRVGQQDGLLDEHIHQILEDAQGDIWLASERGLIRIKPSDLDAYLSGRAKDLPTAVYTAEDGLPSEDMYSIFDPPAARIGDGTLFFVNQLAVTVVRPPERITFPPPTVKIEEAVINGTVYALQGSLAPILAPPGRGDLTIRYAAPTFVSPHRLRFRYRLDGFDDHWVAAGARRRALYTNLPPGEYVFRVVAFDQDTLLPASAATLAFKVLPTFKQTTTFKVLIGLAVAACFLLVLRLRARRASVAFERILEERRRIARDLHDTLAQVFSAIGFELDYFKRSVPADATVLHGRLAQARQTLDCGRRSARAAVWSLRAETGRPGSLFEAFEQMAKIYQGVHIRVSTSGEAYSLAPSLESDLILIVQEAMSNAIEHGGVELMTIEIAYEPRRFTLWVRDNGSGFSAHAGGPAAPGHFGLAGMAERAERSGGKLHVESSQGVGTEISVVIEDPRRRERVLS